MIKVACIDKRAVERLKLIETLESALISSRDEGGFFLNISPIPLSKEEALVSLGFDLILIGSGYQVEEALLVAKVLRDHFPSTPIIAQVTPDNYTISKVRQIKRYTNAVISTGDPYQRLLLTIGELEGESVQKELGQLVTIQSAKGGTGCTSIAVALAHCAGALGRSSVYVDLSLQADALHFLNSEKITSRDFTSFLRGELRYDEALVDKMLFELPNGLTVLLQPEGGTDIRELWLRDTNKLEAVLQVFESLQTRFDNVIVDLGQNEGIVPFALSTRANNRIVITSNEPASIHLNSLLIERLTRFIPTGIHVFVNRLLPKGLTEKDVHTYLETRCGLGYSKLGALDYDSYAKGWVASGNTMFTESRKSSKIEIEKAYCALNKITTETALQRNGWFKRNLKALPAPQIKLIKAENDSLNFVRDNIVREKEPVLNEIKDIVIIAASEVASNSEIEVIKLNPERASKSKLDDTGEFKIVEDFEFDGELADFEITPPRLAGQKGSCSLEQVLLITGALVGAVGAYQFCINLSLYIEGLK